MDPGERMPRALSQLMMGLRDISTGEVLEYLKEYQCLMECKDWQACTECLEFRLFLALCTRCRLACPLPSHQDMSTMTQSPVLLNQRSPKPPRNPTPNPLKPLNKDKQGKQANPNRRNQPKPLLKKPPNSHNPPQLSRR